MARDRQRSKARQQQRREQRLAERREAAALEGRPQEALDDAEEADLLEAADLEVGAPLEDIGRSDRTLRDEPPPPSFAVDDEELADDHNGDPEEAGTRGPRGVRGGREGADSHQRGRLVAFLVAVWAELQRVQWPDRRQLTQLTGVVLFFVLIVGAYLGALDAVFSKLIQAIL
ncbi:MAG: preprotein translocase subunit SecE [Thermoleophilaceae bacterium]|jgi:preprotein translocase subunit SecE|nr:preprotein translocase subunit SecE [Thermoleophilaceae bacterium]